MKFSGIILLVFLLMAPVTAQVNSRYLYFSAGAAQMDAETEIPGAKNIWTVSTNTSTGLIFSLGGGYSVWDNLRIDYEISYRSFKIDDLELLKMNVVGVGVQGGRGEVVSLSFMLNGWYDIYLARTWMIYLGGGLGLAGVTLKDVYVETAPIFPNAVSTESLLVDSKDWRFAMQMGFGIAFEVSHNLMIDLGYKLFASADPRFVTTNNDKFFGEFQTSNFLITFKYIY